MKEPKFKVSPINVHNFGMHYFYGYGDTFEEALADALVEAKKRDPEAYIDDTRVFFKQPVTF